MLAAGTAKAASTTGRSIELDEIRVDGNSVLNAREIEETVYPFLGPDRTAVDVEHARAALAALYARHGYQTVSVIIPPQHVTQGIVYLKVVEQSVERLRVIGARHVEPAVLKRQAPSLHKGKVPNFNDVKHDVAALNALPDRSVTPSFRPGRTPNTVDVDLAVQDSLPVHATLELNNRRSANTTALRLNGSVSYDNFFQDGDTGSLFFQVAPSKTADSRVLGGSYLFHIPSTIMALSVSYVNSDSNVNTVGGLNVVGKGDIATVQLQLPLTSSDNFIQSFTAGISYKKLAEIDSEGLAAADKTDETSTAASAINGQSDPSTISSNNYPVTYYPLTLGYEGDWTTPKATTSLTASATFGLRGLGSTDSQFGLKRAFSNQNFAYVRAGFTRTQTLPRDFQAYIDLTGQISADALLSTEQLDIGGIDTVRGYLESEALGDQGVAGQVEFRTPSLAKYLGKQIDSWRFHVFADAGNISNHRSLVDTAGSYTLSSAGIGTRITLFSYLNATVEDAFLLSRGPSSRAGNNRVLFRIYGSF